MLQQFYLDDLWKGLTGNAGAIGWYSVLERLFVAFGILSPVCFFIDAPFGKFITESRFSVNGSIGWWLMEIVSPLAFLVSLPLGQSSSSLHLPSISTIYDTFKSLPLARQILVTLFVVHYINRSTISTVQNPSRARMNLLVPISAIIFNIMNGSTMGMWIGGGYSPSQRHVEGSGLKSGKRYQALFCLGIAIWVTGFFSNIYHDKVLYDIKREKLNQPSQGSKSIDPKTRYSIPPRSKGLYRYVSHPSYSSEWFEWLGYLLCTFSLLTTAPFPPSTLRFDSSSSSSSSFYGSGSTTFWDSPLVPLQGWYLQPPALFLWQEIGVMLPRARAGHKWYERTFGKKEWEEKGQKWIVIPGIY